ncbi:hypothetical protein AAG747_19325 [Rapidithrix thailandica]|uniref:Uncharacterized protein n=1 Tax=Rapidithrix thailandica TaxID=413964 RepID=A0AAW9SAV0_9BACT
MKKVSAENFIKILRGDVLAFKMGFIKENTIVIDEVTVEENIIVQNEITYNLEIQIKKVEFQSQFIIKKGEFLKKFSIQGGNFKHSRIAVPGFSIEGGKFSDFSIEGGKLGYASILNGEFDRFNISGNTEFRFLDISGGIFPNKLSIKGDPKFDQFTIKKVNESNNVKVYIKGGEFESICFEESELKCTEIQNAKIKNDFSINNCHYTGYCKILENSCINQLTVQNKCQFDHGLLIEKASTKKITLANSFFKNKSSVFAECLSFINGNHNTLSIYSCELLKKFYISNGTFKGKVFISRNEFGKDFVINGGSFEDEIKITEEGDTEGNFEISNGIFKGKVFISPNELEKGFVINGGSFEDEVKITGGKFKGDFKISKGEFEKSVVFEGGTFYKDLKITGGNFKEKLIIKKESKKIK